MGPVDVAIVGGGASGTLVAVQLLRQARGPWRIALVERSGALARGLAYGPAEPCHVLNVPAAVIARDALYGGIAGLAVGGGVALLNSGDNWGRDLMIGAGAGLLVGAIFGAVDAASAADRYMAVADSAPRMRDLKSQNDRSAGLGYGMKF